MFVPYLTCGQRGARDLGASSAVLPAATPSECCMRGWQLQAGGWVHFTSDLPGFRALVHQARYPCERRRRQIRKGICIVKQVAARFQVKSARKT